MVMLTSEFVESGEGFEGRNSRSFFVQIEQTLPSLVAGYCMRMSSSGAGILFVGLRI
jgi:hypothetical protein